MVRRKGLGNNMVSLFEMVFGDRASATEQDSIFDKVNIRCPCGASFILREGLDSAKFAKAAENFVEAHKEHKRAEKK